MWNVLRSSCLPWVEELWTKVSKERTPLLAGPVLYVAADYSEHPKGLHEVYGLVLIDLAGAGTWFSRRHEIRQGLLPLPRRMSYKAMNDAVRRKALIPFLETANSLPGLCAVVAVDKRLGNLVSTPELLDGLTQASILQGKWKPKAFERMCRICLFAAFFICGLSHQNQHVYLISDNDNIFANASKSADVARVLATFTELLSTHELGEKGIGTTSIDPGDCIDEDLTAIADLIAGASAEAIDARVEAYGPLANVVVPAPRLSPKAEIIMDWFSTRCGQPLHKLGLAISGVPGQGFRVGTWFLANDPSA